MKTKKRYVAMIPARMKSQRIPKKNIRLLAGKPLIDYPIGFAKTCGLFDSIWVNTESEQLGAYAIKKGVQFHQRPAELASNTATNREFTYEFLKKHVCDYVVMLNPTSPALRQKTVNDFIAFLEKTDYDTILSVNSEKTESFYLKKPINFDPSEKINSQLLEPVHHLVWALTAWKRDYFISAQENGKNPIFGDNIGLYTIPKDETADLDTEEDWRIAEGVLLSRSMKSNEKKAYLDIL